MKNCLRNYIIAQHAEADEFSKGLGCWMGKLPNPRDTQYWNERVPSGTLQEFKRIELEEGTYYALADAYSKSYARSLDLASMSDDELNKLINDCVRYSEVA